MLHLNLKTLAASRNIDVREITYYEQRGMLTSDKVGRERIYDTYSQRMLDFILMCRRLRFGSPEIANFQRTEEVVRKLRDPRVAIRVWNFLSEATVARQIEKLGLQRDFLVSAIKELSY